MIGAVVVLAAVLAPALWLFVRRQPETDRPLTLRRFNLAVIAVAVACAAGISTYVWATTGQSVDRAWWPVLAVMGGVLLVGIVLGAGALIRSFVFRSVLAGCALLLCGQADAEVGVDLPSSSDRSGPRRLRGAGPTYVDLVDTVGKCVPAVPFGPGGRDDPDARSYR